MIRRTAVLAALAVVSGVFVAAAPAATAAADTNYALPGLGYSDMAVAAAQGRLFISGNDNKILVRSLDGAPVTSLAPMAGARGLTLSADGGTLYAALSANDAIAAYDTTTLVETARYATGAQTCPSDVAIIGTALWFGYGCGSGSWAHRVGVVDLAAEPPAVTLAKTDPTFYAGVWVVAAGDRLLVTGKGSSPTTLYSYPVTGTTLGTPATMQFGGASDIAVTPDNLRVIVPPGPSYSQPIYNVADLSNAGSFSSNHPYPNSALAANGYLVSGVRASGDPDIRIYRESDGAPVRTYELGAGYYTLIEHGLASTPDLSVLYAVSEYWDGTGRNTHTLHVRHDPTRIPTAFTLSKPATMKVGTAYTLTGTLSAGAGKVVHVKRSSKYGTVTLANRTTGSGGSFAITDKVAKRGAYTYTLSFAGDSTYAASTKAFAMTVRGLTPALSMITNATIYNHLATARVLARLGPTYTNRTVTITAKPLDRTGRTLVSAKVDSNGYLRTTHTLYWKTTYTASFAGDDVYEPRKVTRTVRVYAAVSQTLSGYYATSNGYRLYRRTADPVVSATARPSTHGCFAMTAQRYTSGAWRTVSTASCVGIGGSDEAVGVLTGDPMVGVPYRIRSTFTGNSYLAAKATAYQYLRFT
ncbi:MAG TPA: hypothetical protein VNA20_14865 [Frankiaceae bacterium]|nr:hypothetical protein [Frankiaceae bacterium]